MSKRNFGYAIATAAAGYAVVWILQQPSASTAALERVEDIFDALDRLRGHTGQIEA